MSHELKELKQDYSNILTLENARRFISRQINDLIVLYRRPITEEEGRKFQEEKRIIFEKIHNIQDKYSTLFDGIYYDDYEFSPFTDFLLVMIRLLEQKEK